MAAGGAVQQASVIIHTNFYIALQFPLKFSLMQIEHRTAAVRRLKRVTCRGGADETVAHGIYPPAFYIEIGHPIKKLDLKNNYRVGVFKLRSWPWTSTSICTSVPLIDCPVVE